MLERLNQGQIGSIYPFLRRLGNGPNEGKDKRFQLPDQLRRNLSDSECSEEIAIYFSDISQQYRPLNIKNLPLNIQNFLESPDNESLPCLSEYEVHQKILKAKKPNSLVKGDVHPKLMKCFDVEMMAPATVIFNSIILPKSTLLNGR